MMLKREGVQYLFGIPGGGGTIDLLDAMRWPWHLSGSPALPEN
jgi:thiamine pyrophosphate-dependent acetolactate synthase large subunit-like protein